MRESKTCKGAQAGSLHFGLRHGSGICWHACKDQRVRSERGMFLRPQLVYASDLSSIQQRSIMASSKTAPLKSKGGSSKAVSDNRAAIEQAIISSGQHMPYRVSEAGDNRYVATHGNLAANALLCGCFAQYYSFEIVVYDSVFVKSTKPCNGFWEGPMGMRRSREEKEKFKKTMQSAFPDKRIV